MRRPDQRRNIPRCHGGGARLRTASDRPHKKTRHSPVVHAGTRACGDGHTCRPPAAGLHERRMLVSSGRNSPDARRMESVPRRRSRRRSTALDTTLCQEHGDNIGGHSLCRRLDRSRQGCKFHPYRRRDIACLRFRTTAPRLGKAGGRTRTCRHGQSCGNSAIAYILYRLHPLYLHPADNHPACRCCRQPAHGGTVPACRRRHSTGHRHQVQHIFHAGHHTDCRRRMVRRPYSHHNTPPTLKHAQSSSPAPAPWPSGYSRHGIRTSEISSATAIHSTLFWAKERRTS